MLHLIRRDIVELEQAVDAWSAAYACVELDGATSAASRRLVRATGRLAVAAWRVWWRVRETGEGRGR